MRERYEIREVPNYAEEGPETTFIIEPDKVCFECQYNNGLHTKEEAEHQCNILNLEDIRDRYARIALYLMVRTERSKDVTLYDHYMWGLQAEAQELALEAQRELNELYRTRP